MTELDEAASQPPTTELSGWALFSRGGKDDTAGLITDLVMVRELSTDELQAVRQASRDLRQLEAGWGWNTFLRNRALVERDIHEAKTAAAASGGTYNQHHINRISDTYKEMLSKLTEWIGSIEPSLRTDEEGEHRALRAACLQFLDQATVYTTLLSASTADPVVELAQELGDDLESPTAARTSIPLSEVGELLVGELQPLAALDVLQGRGKLEGAIQRLLRLRVEAFRGRPCLLQPAQVAAGGRVEVEELPYERIDATIRVIRISEAIEQQVTTDGVDGASPKEPDSALADEVAQIPTPASRDGSGATAGLADELVEGIPPPSTDWTRLIAEALHLSEDLERAWSNALPAELEKNKSVGERMSAILSVLYRETDRQEKLNRQAGLSNNIPIFPLDGPAALHLSLHSQPATAQGRGLAALYAVREIAGLIAGLGVPQDNFSKERRLWVNGDFQQLRTLGTNLLGVMELDAAKRHDWHSSLVAMRWSVAHGFAEGGLLYANLCVGHIRSAGLHDLLPFEEDLRNALTEQLQNVATMLCSGASQSWDLTWPLAYFWRDTLNSFEYRWFNRRPRHP